MHIALIAHDNKKELMEAFCIAYSFVLKKHRIHATGGTGAIVAESAGLSIQSLDFGSLGEEQIIARIAYNEIDLVLYFGDPDESDDNRNLLRLWSLCDRNNIPLATNLAAAEIMINGLERGDFAWRELVAR
jgi:methylglyoxal synthase